MSGPRHETITQSSFPNLQILPVEDLLPHEEHDMQRSAPLIERLRQATHWLNPPIAAPILNSGQYVVLDGANRHYCLSALGYRHILAQVVDYESEAVTLQTWHHAVRAIQIREFLPPLFDVGGVQVEETTLLNARAGLAARKLLGYVVMRDTRVFALRQQDMHSTRTTLLREVVNSYRHTARISRVAHDEFTDIQESYPDVLALVVFPRYEPAEIMVAARDGDLLPPGITRHIIAGRALRLNYPLDDLRYDNLPLEEKNDRLRQWIQARLAAKHVRYYAEPTFVFDE